MEQQRTKEWHKKRQGRITGSRAGAILGVSPFATAASVMRDMIAAYKGAEGENLSNPAMDYGNNFEEYALTDYNFLHAKDKVEETGFHIHATLPWLGASPDGLLGKDGVLEIKCPFGKRKEDAETFKSVHEQQHYYTQIQLEMYCTGRKWCDFYQWSPYAESLERVELDQKWLDTNIPKLKAFYDRYLIEREDDNAELILLLVEYKELNADIKELIVKQKEMAEIIVKATDEHGKDLGTFGKITKVERKGTIDYNKIKELENVDLEEYRKPGSSYWKISV